MKVDIGPYLDYLGPYQLAQKILFFMDKESDRVHAFGAFLDKPWLADFLQKRYDKRKRRIVVKIDKYDTWSADSTLAYIIHPLLVQLKEQSHGYFFVDDEDVPDELKSTSAPPDEEHESGWDSLAQARCTYALDQMIYSFSRYNDDWESKFFEHPKESTADRDDIMARVAEIKYDEEGLTKERAKIHNGIRLFGKYYNHLWT